MTDLERMLLDHPDLSNRRIASACGVSHTHVGRVRRELERTGRLRSPEKRETSDGRMRTVAPAPVDATYEGGLAAVVKRIWGIP